MQLNLGKFQPALDWIDLEFDSTPFENEPFHYVYIEYFFQTVKFFQYSKEKNFNWINIFLFIISPDSLLKQRISF